MENWREDAQPGHTHDPNEVTVQIDGIGRLMGGELTAGDRPDPSDKPVFVDESGSRGRRVRRIGWIMGVVCAVYAVVLISTLASGNSDAPWMPGLGADDKPAGKVKPDPSPTGPGSATSSTGATPGPGQSATGTQNPTPSNGATSDPDPSGSASKPVEPSGKPTGGNPDPDPDPSTPGPDPSASQPDPDPPSSTEPTPDPSGTADPPGGVVGGTGQQPVSVGSPSDILVLLAGAAL